jgi:2-polyprenyl-6-methoxyphenol hydroxylase-like FAD-dependent oxidoreductase
MDADVIIIGAGPTGLMAACQLKRHGVSCIVIDSKASPTLQSRALLVTARSLEIYDQLGIVQEVIDHGTAIREVSIFTYGQERLNFPIGRVGEGLTDFPYMHVFEQSKNEQLLCDYLARVNQTVNWNTEFSSLEQDQSGVSVQLIKHGKEDEVLNLRARYLIGCDGASSKIRHALGTKFEGGTYKHKFYIADLKIKWAQPPGKLILSLGRSKFCGFFPMQGENNYRVLGTLGPTEESDAEVKFEDVEPEILSIVDVPLAIGALKWFSTYRLHHRCVDKFRVGNCFLAGDAAHIHSPAGGQGMNTGLQDAYNLSWKLAMVLQGHTTENLLDTYHSERQPFAKWLLKFTDRAFGTITSGNILISWLRLNIGPLILRMLIEKPGLGKNMFRTVSQIWYGYWKSSLSQKLSRQRLRFKAGDRFPYVLVSREGMKRSVYHLLEEPKFHLVILSNSIGEIAVQIPESLKAVIKTVLLPLDDTWSALGVRVNLYILVRPDNYIGLIADNLDGQALERYFKRM